MKKKFFLIIINICSLLIFAQNKKESKPDEGSCKDVINYFQKLHGNDSVSIEIFKKEYQIFNKRNNDRISLIKKNYLEIIQYINSVEGKDCFCRSIFLEMDINKNIFLLDRDISSSKK